MFLRSSFLIVVLFFTSCSYQSSLQEVKTPKKTICIPYAKGDGDGTFTAILYEKMAKKGLFRVSRSCGDLKLLIQLENPSTESVGFRYETNLDGVLGQRLVASEEEARIVARMELVDLRKCQTVWGPICVKEEVRFDFAPDTSPQTDITFSAGQVDFEPAAKDAVMEPLYNRLADKICELLWVYSIDHAL
ncbi:MAG: hypothetical protein WCN87_03575 [Chlamydiota bacterium]